MTIPEYTWESTSCSMHPDERCFRVHRDGTPVALVELDPALPFLSELMQMIVGAIQGHEMKVALEAESNANTRQFERDRQTHNAAHRAAAESLIEGPAVRHVPPIVFPPFVLDALAEARRWHDENVGAPSAYVQGPAPAPRRTFDNGPGEMLVGGQRIPVIVTRDVPSDRVYLLNLNQLDPDTAALIRERFGL